MDQERRKADEKVKHEAIIDVRSSDLFMKLIS
jgi:hypothetical protein